MRIWTGHPDSLHCFQLCPENQVIKYYIMNMCYFFTNALFKNFCSNMHTTKRYYTTQILMGTIFVRFCVSVIVLKEYKGYKRELQERGERSLKHDTHFSIVKHVGHEKLLNACMIHHLCIYRLFEVAAYPYAWLLMYILLQLLNLLKATEKPADMADELVDFSRCSVS